VKPPQWSVLTKICFPTGFIVVFVPNQVNGVGQNLLESIFCNDFCLSISVYQ